jgi:3-oxoacyl-[acyl-carrier-protein] synthase-3
VTGIEERRYAEAGQCSSGLAAAAASTLVRAERVPLSSIDTLIFAAASHDVAEPATANRVQALLGCTSARAMDVKNACNSFLDGLDVGRALVLSGRAERVMVVSGEVLSPFVELSIPDGVPREEMIGGTTLGDAGAAALIESERLGCTDPLASIGAGRFTTLGEHWSSSRILAGGSLRGRDFSDAYFRSDSRKLFSLAIEHVGAAVADVLAQEGWSANDVDLVVPHQASAAVTHRICAVTGVDPNRCVLTGERFGNTAAASIPLALSVASDEGLLKRAERVLLVGGAAGFSAAAVPLRRRIA